MIDGGGACARARAWSDECGFSERERSAIGMRLRPYPGWSVFFGTGNGTEYARVSAGDALPTLVLARQDGLTGFAVMWADGSSFCTALPCSLSAALAHIVQAIEDAAAPCPRQAGAGPALTGAGPAPI